VTTKANAHLPLSTNLQPLSTISKKKERKEAKERKKK
jgi:hypothetical protein